MYFETLGTNPKTPERGSTPTKDGYYRGLPSSILENSKMYQYTDGRWFLQGQPAKPPRYWEDAKDTFLQK